MADSGGSEKTYLLVPILLIAILLGVAVVRGPNLVSLSGFGSAVIVAAPLILATYSLMATAIAGRGTTDLAVGPLLAFINVSIVQLNGLGIVTSPIGVFVVAIGIGVIYQILFALVILYVRVQPIIVALSGFLALTGINLVIQPRPGGVSPEWMGQWGMGNTVFSPVLLILIIATCGWLLFTTTTFYANLRMMGYDERAAYTSGVRIYPLRIGAHVISGIFVGLGAICYTALISSGDPTQGTTLTLTAITALVLGGVALTGGRGSITGALLGALNLFTIGYVLATFNFGAVQAFVTQLLYGLILVLSLLLTLLVPKIGRHLSFISPYAAFVVLATIVVGIMLHVASDRAAAQPGLPVQAMSGSTAIIPVTNLNTSNAPDASSSANKSGMTSNPATVSAAKEIERYFLLPAVVSGRSASEPDLPFSPSPFQRTALAAAAALGLLVILTRAFTVEAISRRFGVFSYVSIGALLLLLLLVFGMAARSGVPSP